MRGRISLLSVIRPHIVLGGILGYTLGVLFPSVQSRQDPFVIMLGYLAVLLTDLSTHYSNDYFDLELDKEAEWKPFGGNNVLIEQPYLGSWMIRVAILLSVSSLVLAIFLVIHYDTRLFFLGLILLGNLLGWGYSNPWTHLKARGLGELAISIFTGIIVPTSGYLVSSGSLSMGFLLFTLPLVLYGFMLSVFLEIPDYDVDKEHGIENLVVRFGIKRMIFLCTALMALNTSYYLTGIIPYIPKMWLSSVSLCPLIACVVFLLIGFESRKNIEFNVFLVISSLFAFVFGVNVVLIFFQ